MRDRVADDHGLERLGRRWRKVRKGIGGVDWVRGAESHVVACLAAVRTALDVWNLQAALYLRAFSPTAPPAAVKIVRVAAVSLEIFFPDRLAILYGRDNRLASATSTIAHVPGETTYGNTPNRLNLRSAWCSKHSLARSLGRCRHGCAGRTHRLETQVLLLQSLYTRYGRPRTLSWT